MDVMYENLLIESAGAPFSDEAFNRVPVLRDYLSPYLHRIDSQFCVFKVCPVWRISVYFYETAHQNLTKPHTLSPIGPTFIFFC